MTLFTVGGSANVPLASVEAEHGVLTALLKDSAFCSRYLPELVFPDFTDPDNKATFKAIEQALEAGEVDGLPPVARLAVDQRPLPSGEMLGTRITALFEQSAANGASYFATLKDRAALRRVVTNAHALIAGIENPDIGTDVKVSKLQALLDSALVTLAPVAAGMVAQGQSVDALDERTRQLASGEIAPGLKIGLGPLDRFVDGMRAGQLIVIGGRPGVGKTVMGYSAVLHEAYANGGAPLVFSMEMSALELDRRAVASMARIPLGDLKNGAVVHDPQAYARMRKTIKETIKRGDLRQCDTAGLRIDQICAIAKQAHRIRPATMVLVDHFGLIQGPPGTNAQNRSQEIGQYSRALKRLAMELGVPVIALSQLNRGIEGRGPDAKARTSDIRESGDIEADADVIIILHHPEGAPDGITEASVIKNRDGECGACTLMLEGPFARFRPAEPGESVVLPVQGTSAAAKPRRSRDYPDKWRDDD